jgi:hypothetical protein
MDEITNAYKILTGKRKERRRDLFIFVVYSMMFSVAQTGQY